MAPAVPSHRSRRRSPTRTPDLSTAPSESDSESYPDDSPLKRARLRSRSATRGPEPRSSDARSRSSKAASKGTVGPALKSRRMAGERRLVARRERQTSGMSSSGSGESESTDREDHVTARKKPVIKRSAKLVGRNNNVWDGEAEYMDIGGAKVRKSDLEAFLKQIGRGREFMPGTMVGGGGSEGQGVKEGDDFAIYLGVEESDEEEEMEEMREKARNLAEALEEPLEHIMSQSTANLAASLKGMTSALQTALEPFRGEKILQQLQLWVSTEKSIGAEASKQWAKATSPVNKSREAILGVLQQIEEIHKEKERLVDQARTDFQMTLQRQGREIEEFRKELEKSKDKHQRKMAKATDKERIQKERSMAYQQIMAKLYGGQG